MFREIDGHTATMFMDLGRHRAAMFGILVFIL